MGEATIEEALSGLEKLSKEFLRQIDCLALKNEKSTFCLQLLWETLNHFEEEIESLSPNDSMDLFNKVVKFLKSIKEIRRRTYIEMTSKGDPK